MQKRKNNVPSTTYEDDIEITNLPEEEGQGHAISNTLLQFGSHWETVPLRLRRRIFSSVIVALTLLIVLSNIPTLSSASGNIAHFFVPPSNSSPTPDSTIPSIMSVRKVGSIEVIRSLGSNIVVNTNTGSWQTGDTLEPAPTCPALNADNNVYYHGKWHGRSNPFGPVSILDFQLLGNTVHILHSTTPTSFGWAMLIRFQVKKGFGEPIALTGSNMIDGVPLTFDIVPYNVPINPFTFDPLHPLADPIHSDPSARIWDMHMYIPESGCYLLEVRWTGGIWQAKFAAGK